MVIGINEEKRRDKQDVLINLVLDADTRAAGRSNDIADTLNYRTLTKRIIELVENSQFCLVEKLAAGCTASEMASLGKTSLRPDDPKLSLRSSL